MPFRCCRWLSSLFPLMLLMPALPGKALPAAQPAPVRLVTQRVDESSRMTLRGNTLLLARRGQDMGAVSPGMPADRMLLVLRRSPAQQAALESFLRDVQNPASPSFRKFVTPADFGRLYGIGDADLQAVKSWLQSHGLQVTHINQSRTALEFSGTVGQLEQALHTSLHTYALNGQQHMANANDPSIPAALAPVVAGVASLSDLKPHPMFVPGPKGTWNTAQRRFQPQLTAKVGSTSYLFVGPGDAATIYDTPNTLNTRLPSGQTIYDGTGISIGVVGDVYLASSGPSFYRSLFGLGGNAYTTVTDGDFNNLPANGDQTEASLDVEVSGGLAPGASVIYYAAGDTVFEPGLFLAINRAIEDNTVHILSVSYGACEAYLGAGGNQFILSEWQQAAAQGITVTVSSGDSGAAGCDNFNTQTSATGGFAVNGLASTPYNIAVGGTDFDALHTSFSTYAGSSNSANYTSALSYIPEKPWNNSTSVNGLLSANLPLSNSGKTNIVAGSGGASSLGAVDGGGNQIPYPKPLWQQNFAPSNKDSARDLPDVSLFAGSGLYNAVWAYCGPFDCSSGGNSTISGVGGTSASSPAFAGMLALVNQMLGASTRLGQANWVLYQLAQNDPTVFHAMQGGNNSVYCSTGSPNCGANNFLTGYNSASGYSLAAGLGSVDALQMVNRWNSIAQTASSTSLTLGATTLVHGTPVSVQVAVTPTAASGQVALANDDTLTGGARINAPPLSLTLSGGTASGTYSQLPGGTYHVTANYGGDGVYQSSQSQPVSVTVTPEDSVLHFTANSVSSTGQLSNVAGQTVPLGTVISFNAQPVGVSQASNPNPITDATGNIILYNSNTSTTISGQFAIDSTGNAEFNSISLSAGNYPVYADYLGDPSYNFSTSPTIDFTVAQAPTTVTAGTSATTVFSGPFNMYGQVAANVPASAFSAYGTVTLTDTTNNTVLGSTGGGGFPCQNSTTLCEQFVLSVNVDQLAMGSNSIVATYSGDTNFLGSGPSAPVTVDCTAGCGNGTGQTLSLAFYSLVPGDTISPGGTITTTVAVSGGGGFTGAVNLSCSVAGNNTADIHLPTCSFKPTPVTISDTQAVDSTLTLNTTAPTTAAMQPGAGPQGATPWAVSGGAVLAAVLLFGIPSRRRRFRIFLALALLACLFGTVSACGGGGSTSGGGGGSTTKPGTTPDVYTVTFRATDAATGTVTAQDYFKFNVN